MRSRFWTFVEACDEARTARAVRDLLVLTYRDLGVTGFAIATHAPKADLRSLGVLVHNLSSTAIEHLIANDPAIFPNPLLAAVECTNGPVFWPPLHSRRDLTKKHHRAWFDRLRALTGEREGVSQRLRSVIVTASCSLTCPAPLDPDTVRLCMRIGDYAYQHVLVLQRPELSDQEHLTAREHQFLYHATILGERPSNVASELGVKISTVRTLRQKANIRLDAGSQEQAAWRMLETGQLFRSGRTSRRRSR